MQDARPDDEKGVGTIDTHPLYFSPLGATMTEKKPHGRPPFRPTDEMRTIVETLSAAGFPAGRIASLVKNPATGRPVSEPTIRKHFATELATGAASVEALAAATLVEAMRRGSVPASTWWLSRRCGWREAPLGLEVSGSIVTKPEMTPAEVADAYASARDILNDIAARKVAGEDVTELLAAAQAMLAWNREGQDRRLGADS